MTKLGYALLAGAAITGAMSAPAFGQAIPNYGNYEARTANYRIGVQIVSPLLQAPISDAFEQDVIEDIQESLDPSVIAQALVARGTNAILAVQIANTGTVSQVFDLAGAPVLAGYTQNSSTLTVRFVNADGTTLTAKGLTCSFTYTGQTRQQAYNTFDADTEDGTATSNQLARCLGLSKVRNSPVDPLAGNPQSLQASMTRAALDFTEGDSLVELGDNANAAGDPWIIGATYSFGKAGRFDTGRIDARINKGWRVFEGNRARLKVDLPFSYVRVKGASAYNGQLGLAVEYPVQPNWSLEPRVAYGLVYGADLGTVGHMVQGSVASRFVIRTAGRGLFLIGNMAGYAKTLATPGDINLNPDIGAFTFRNGAAYELPLKGLVGGRATSLRASYAFSNYVGAKLRNNSFHEASVSFGIRGREDTPKQFRDIVRLNLNTVQAKGFSTYTAGLGFRF